MPGRATLTQGHRPSGTIYRSSGDLIDDYRIFIALGGLGTVPIFQNFAPGASFCNIDLGRALSRLTPGRADQRLPAG